MTIHSFLNPKHFRYISWSSLSFLGGLSPLPSPHWPSASRTRPPLPPGTSRDDTRRWDPLTPGSHIHMLVSSSTIFKTERVDDMFFYFNPFWIVSTSLPRRVFSLHVPFGNVMIMCLWVSLLSFIVLGPHWTCIFQSFRYGKYSWMLDLMDCSSIFLTFSHIFQLCLYFLRDSLDFILQHFYWFLLNVIIFFPQRALSWPPGVPFHCTLFLFYGHNLH